VIYRNEPYRVESYDGQNVTIANSEGSTTMSLGGFSALGGYELPEVSSLGDLLEGDVVQVISRDKDIAAGATPIKLTFKSGRLHELENMTAYRPANLWSSNKVVLVEEAGPADSPRTFPRD
jgi:hypothetical protein